MEIRRVDYDHPDAVALRDSLQRFYVERYGGPDEAPVDPDDFRPPRGEVLVGYIDGRPVASGSWRSAGVDRLGTTRTAEVKRVLVIPELRRRGLARRLLTEIEERVRKAGHEAVILLTGLRQPEAIELYRRSGYTPIAGFGHYADDAGCVFFGKRL